jgi:hypothetical protein
LTLIQSGESAGSIGAYAGHGRSWLTLQIRASTREDEAVFKIEGLDKLSGLLPRLETVPDDMIAASRVDDGKRIALDRVNHELGN